MLRRVLPLAVLALSLVPTIAQARIGGAVCRIGQGCSCIDFAETGLAPVLAEHADLLGDTTPDEIVVIDRSTNTTFRTRRSPAQVHASFGGQGECPLTPLPTEIIPEDGVWQFQVLDWTATGCPPGMAEELLALDGLAPSSRVEWNGRFDPALLADQSTPQAFRWRESAGQRWVTDRVGERSCFSDFCTDMDLRLWMTLVSPQRARGHLRMISRLQSSTVEMATLMQSFGMDYCRIIVEYRVNRVGN
jgi:hypothetical protein